MRIYILSDIFIYIIYIYISVRTYIYRYIFICSSEDLFKGWLTVLPRLSRSGAVRCPSQGICLCFNIVSGKEGRELILSDERRKVAAPPRNESTPYHHAHALTLRLINKRACFRSASHMYIPTYEHIYSLSHHISIYILYIYISVRIYIYILIFSSGDLKADWLYCGALILFMICPGLVRSGAQAKAMDLFVSISIWEGRERENRIPNRWPHRKGGRSDLDRSSLVARHACGRSTTYLLT